MTPQLFFLLSRSFFPTCYCIKYPLEVDLAVVDFLAPPQIMSEISRGKYAEVRLG